MDKLLWIIYWSIDNSGAFPEYETSSEGNTGQNMSL